jgi:serine/alanine adding enzyme
MAQLPLSVEKTSLPKIKIFKPSQTGLWDDYVMNHSMGTVFHLAGWKNVIERTFAHECLYFYVVESGNIKGILPLAHMKSRMFGSFLVSLPFLNYGGVLSNDTKSTNLLQWQAIKMASDLKAKYIEYRHQEPFLQNMVNKRHKITMLLDLPFSSSILWKNLNAKVRNQVRKAERNNLDVATGRQNKINDFYQVFSRNMRDLGTPVYPISFFINILNEFASARIFVVYSYDKPLAAGFVIGMNGKLDIPWASSIRKYNYLNANMLLYWSILKFACESGYTLFDFGRCTPDSNTYRFKKQWGAYPKPLNWQYWLPEVSSMPNLSPENGKYKLLISLWKKLPLSVAEILGPVIIKNIP